MHKNDSWFVEIIEFTVIVVFNGKEIITDRLLHVHQNGFVGNWSWEFVGNWELNWNLP